MYVGQNSLTAQIHYLKLPIEDPREWCGRPDGQSCTSPDAQDFEPLRTTSA